MKRTNPDCQTHMLLLNYDQKEEKINFLLFSEEEEIKKPTRKFFNCCGVKDKLGSLEEEPGWES